MATNVYAKFNYDRFLIDIGDTFRVQHCTRKLCYRKGDCAMRPTHGALKIFEESLTTPTATIPHIFMGFCSDLPYECSFKI